MLYYFVFIFRSFIQNYFNKNTTSKVVWCVCDGLDKDRTVLMSFQKQFNFINRSIVKVHGYLPEKFKEGTMDKLCSSHNQVSGKFQEKKVSY